MDSCLLIKIKKKIFQIKPYVSDFLIRTIKDSNYELVSTKEARELISDNSLNWISEAAAIRIIFNNPNVTIF